MICAPLSFVVMAGQNNVMTDQPYDVFPFPTRNLADAAKRLVARIPSHRHEIGRALGLKPLGFQLLWLKMHKALIATVSPRYSILGLR